MLHGVEESATTDLNRTLKEPYIMRRNSFFLHMRPRSYRAESISFFNTYYLGFLAVFFIFFECVTGVVLMIYYVPTADGAYGSIVRLTTEVPFGWLMRDLHRIGGELMIVAVVLHMLRVFLSGSYKSKAAFTWITGMVLLLCTLLLAFSGYLLPWDQLAYWAVTIGTSMTETIPFIGGDVAGLLRGGLEFGQDGLLRFYLLHIIGIPFVLMIFLGIHYYRVSRLHGISRPINKQNQNREINVTRVQLFPTITLFEIICSLLIILLLVVVVTWFYDAPLGYHADPRHTPSQTKAPWFFLWLQGALKLGDSFLMGICLPTGLLLMLIMLPIFDRTERKTIKQRPVAIIGLLGLSAIMIVLSLIGLPKYGFDESPITAIFKEITPEEKESSFHVIGYSNLQPGVYETAAIQTGLLSADMNVFLKGLSDKLKKLDNEEISGTNGVVVIEDWQADLKRVTVRISWNEENDVKRSVETAVFVHSSLETKDLGMDL